MQLTTINPISIAFSSVNYHNKCPTFYDEIKIAMPAELKQNHHLFFTLYHVSCQKKPQEVQTSVETPVGYTVSAPDAIIRKMLRFEISVINFAVAPNSE